MKDSPPSGRAGLLAACLRNGFDSQQAEFFGFEAERQSSVVERILERFSEKGGSDEAADANNQTTFGVEHQEQSSLGYTQREPLKFLAEVNRIDLTEPGAADTLSVEGTVPISTEDLAVPKVQLPLTPPLIPWKRVMPFLKLRTGTTVPGRRIYRRELARRLGKGTILTELPHVTFRVWSPQLVVLYDATDEMWSFQDDVSHILARLRLECGEARLLVKEHRFSDESLFETLAPGAPILVLSAMGQLSRRKQVQERWISLGRRLAFRGHPLLALSPCPSNRFRESLKRLWNPVVWDSGVPLPRFGSSPFRSSTIPPESALDLESLLSPASYVRRGLMREARLAMGIDADVATEYEVWHGEGMHASPEMCNPLPDRTTMCLQRRKALREKRSDWVTTTDECIAQFHSDASLPVRLETRIRIGGGSKAEIAEELKPIIARLVELGSKKNPGEAKRTGLPDWIRGFQHQLSPELRRDPTITSLLAEGMAAADEVEKKSEATLREGTSEEAYMRARNQMASSSLPVRAYEVRLVGNRLTFLPIENREERVAGFFLATIYASRPECLLGFQCAGGEYRAVRLDFASESIELVLDSVPDRVSLTTDREIIEWRALVKPEWADRIVCATEERSGDRFYVNGEDLWVESTAIAGHSLRFFFDPSYGQNDDSLSNRRSNLFWHHRVYGDQFPFEWISRDEFGFLANVQVGGVLFLFRWIPPGRFWMGSPEDEKGRSENEGPRHRVEITKGYWLGVTPVTQEQWEVVMGENPSEFVGKVRPVESVSWNTVQQYLEKLNTYLPGLRARLPSEAEWEYACRAGTDGAFCGEACSEPEGSDPAVERLGWYSENSGGETHEVGMKEANGWGLYDMHGNVWEWCADGMREYRYEFEVDPLGSAKDRNRVLRSGSCFAFARICRSASRYVFPRSNRRRNIGFRLVAGQREKGDERSIRESP